MALSTSGGSLSLLQIRTLARQESDTENDPHISDTELTAFVNQSRYELYDILVSRFGEDYYSANATITTDGVNDQFPLPDGTLYSAAPPYYKGALVESQVYGGPTGWVSLQKFNFHEKNKFRLLNYYTIMAQRLPRYRIVGSNLMLAPLPVNGIQVRIWYAPRLAPLVLDADMSEDFSGWLEYVIVDAAIKCVIKQERDPSALMARKRELKERIEAMAQNRDLGEPNTVTEVQTDTFPFGAPFSVFGTGPWGGV